LPARPHGGGGDDGGNGAISNDEMAGTQAAVNALDAAQ